MSAGKGEYTLPKLLSDAGYATALYGKWHLGEVAGRLPSDMGVKSHRTPTPCFASKDDPCDGAETGGAEPQIAEQSRSWRAVISEREAMRGS
jgi:arylsulfatase A-like enzyme